jgi:hypothetical protein
MRLAVAAMVVVDELEQGFAGQQLAHRRGLSRVGWYPFNAEANLERELSCLGTSHAIPWHKMEPGLANREALVSGHSSAAEVRRWQ